MSEFELFKAAVALLADAAANSSSAEQLVERLIARRDTPFYDQDFWAYAVRLQNAVGAGLEEAMNLLGDAK